MGNASGLRGLLRSSAEQEPAIAEVLQNLTVHVDRFDFCPDRTPERNRKMKAEPVMPPAVSSVVLVVDDAPGHPAMLCDALAIEGYTVLVARDAIEALERFEMAVPDASAARRHHAAGENGFALCRRLKSEPSWTHDAGDLHDWF